MKEPTLITKQNHAPFTEQQPHAPSSPSKKTIQKKKAPKYAESKYSFQNKRQYTETT